ncbi:mycofactocin-coupled SDR family oxidoreductase [Streptomyces sp. NBC_00986]|uniref:mycofactocin-coupled SDR family oxidoreductase n=1 Tax=Streptomyces sp. NBC_00986 TaxID=2903702 RepID=UPI0038691E66|nr:mycofactocin-coupled SDR family oxidoreductase [Streptomyces sp. NBC_00986]WSX64534.1 mycofactocin-coupled SDR family oxidoreductase [Streptomyces sp. NBC_00986]
MNRVAGKVVAITGAARGLGRSHAVRLAEEGADIIALDVCQDASTAEYAGSRPSDLDETARLVEKTGRRAVVRQVDVRDRSSLSTALDEAVAELGRLDVVIPNAGISPMGPDRPLSAFTETLDVNFIGAANTVHAALPHLAEGGSVILIGSVAGLMPRYDGNTGVGHGAAGYSLSKHLLTEYADWLAIQLAPSNRRVNVIHPTNVPTELIKNEAAYRTFRPDLENPTADDVEPVFKSVHGMPIAYVETADVSHAVVFLASDESRYITGAQLRIDGGMVAKLQAGYDPRG